MDNANNLNNLLYRRQFILGDLPVKSLAGWQIVPFGSRYLTIHPDLETTISKRANTEFILLGFALNHLQPKATNQDLSDVLADKCSGIDAIVEFCHDLCGRFVILFNISDRLGIISDLIGSRSVYYWSGEKSIWCASQPGTLAKVLGISKDDSSPVRTFIEKDMFASGEASWIGDGSMYKGIKHLLPNHYLDLINGRAVRYWPKTSRPDLEMEAAAVSSARILENTMRAATNRFSMCMAVTSGWDSRTLLAASRKDCEKFYYYVQKFGGMTDEHPDIRVPLKLAKKAHIPFHVLDCPEYESEEFDAVLVQNVFALHNPAKKVLLWNFYHQFKGRVNASGNISDLCRSVYGSEPITGVDDLLWFVNLTHSEYARDTLIDWFQETKRLCVDLGYNQRDLFFWEQVLGNWGSMFAAELDIAIEEFYPFGTRRLVETILAVDEKLRPYENSQVHRRMIEILWPELLSQPFNPVKWQIRLVRSIRNKGITLLSRLGLLALFKNFRSKQLGHS